MQNDYIILEKRVTVAPILSCNGCQKTVHGPSITAFCDPYDSPAIRDAIRQRHISHYMPTGWSSHYGTPQDIVLCPDCTGD